MEKIIKALEVELESFVRLKLRAESSLNVLVQRGDGHFQRNELNKVLKDAKANIARLSEALVMFGVRR